MIGFSWSKCYMKAQKKNKQDGTKFISVIQHFHAENWFLKNYDFSFIWPIDLSSYFFLTCSIPHLKLPNITYWMVYRLLRCEPYKRREVSFKTSNLFCTIIFETHCMYLTSILRRKWVNQCSGWFFTPVRLESSIWFDFNIIFRFYFV